MSHAHYPFVRAAALALLLAALAVGPAAAQGARKSSQVVKAEAKADKPAADGTQTVTVTLTIDKGWHLYANPVGFEDLESNQTTVTFGGKSKPQVVKVDYPAGKAVKDKALMAEYKTYEDKAAIKATVRRAKGDDGPLEVVVKVAACNDRTCLPADTIKISVP